MSPRIALLFLACLLACDATAQTTTIYRCTDANGAVTMQNDKPCAPGMKQEVRRVGELPTAPAPAPRPAAAPVPSGPPPGAQFELVRGPAVDALPESKLAPADRKPPPTLYECRTFEDKTYLNETGEGESRCVLMNTVGLNGDPNFGAGQACEVKQDTCTALAGDALCRAWHRRVEEAKFRMTFASEGDKPARKAEYERQLALLVDSTCR